MGYGRFILNITARFIGRFVTGVPRATREVYAPPCFPYVERGEIDAKCNPYNVTPKRARNSNIMDSVSPHRNTRALLYIALYAVVLSIPALAADSTRW